MFGHPDRSACLIFSFQTIDPGPLLKMISAVLEVWDTSADLESIPMHWSFPACTLESRTGTDTRLVPVIKERLAAGAVTLLPRGYSGAPHIVLLSGDVKRDLQWAITNPWHSGIGDIFDGHETIVFPTSPDAHRESVWSHYDSGSNNLLLEFYDRTLGTTLFIHRTEKESWILPLIRYPAEKRALSSHFKRWPSAGVINIDLYPWVKPDHIVSHVHDLREFLELGVSFRRLTDAVKAQGSIGRSALLSIPVISAPSAEAGRSTTGYSGTEVSASAKSLATGKIDGRQNRAITRERLCAAGGAVLLETPPPARRAVPGAIERTLIADMFGSVSIFNGDISIRFEEGQLAGISLGNAPVLCGRAMSSYYIEEIRCDFANSGAFSFDGEGCHGLRATQTIQGKRIIRNGSVVRDFFVLDGESSLFVSTICRRPTISRGVKIEAWACFELPVFELTHSSFIEVETRALDGEKSALDLTGCDGEFLFAGNAFRLRNSEFAVCITYPKSGHDIIRLLPVRITTSGRKSIISMSPGGCYHPAPGECYSGFADHTVFAIDVQAADNDTFPEVGSAVYSETGPLWHHLTAE